MKLIKKCRGLKTFLAAILIISIASQSLTAYAAGKDGSSANSSPSGSTTDVATADGFYNGYGWVISIQKAPNTATGSSGYAESKESFVNAWLHNFPDEYCTANPNSLYQSPSSYAFILNSGSTATANKYRVYNPNFSSTSTTGKLVPCYKAASGTSNFERDAQLLENSSYYDNILVGLQTFGKELDVDTLYTAAGNMDAAISSFVGLWRDTGTAADRMNEFVLSDSLDSWEQCVRYLDLLLIVNSMCNRAWDGYINDYLESLNQNGSSEFVAIVVAAAANVRTTTGTSNGLMTLPVYYAHYTGLDVSNFSSWSGSGNWDEVRSTFDNYGSSGKTIMTSTGTAKIWWTQALMATSVAPTGLDDTTNGFCGYTYIAPTIKFSTEDIHPSSSSSNPSASDSEPTTTLTPTFTVEVTTEDAYMQRDTTQPVTATVTIDMSQDDSVRRYFSWLYDTEDLSDYKTAIEVFVERTFSDSSGVDTSNAVMDSDASGGYFASAVQPTLTSAVVYRWQGTDWDSGSNQLQYVMDGTHQIVFDDEGLSLAGVTEGTPLNATYHVGIRMAIYRSSVADEDAFDQATYKWIFQGEGKTICSDSGNSDCSGTFFIGSTTDISTAQSAHDDAEWICPNGVQGYSSLRDENIDALLSQRATKHESRLLRSDELPQ